MKMIMACLAIWISAASAFAMGGAEYRICDVTPMQKISMALRLSYLDCQGKHLEGINVTGPGSIQFGNFNNAELDGAILRDLTFESATFIDADLSGADLNGVRLRHSTFTKAKFREADFTDVTFVRGGYINANFAGATFTAVTISGADAKFSNANLSNTVFRQVTFDDASLAGSWAWAHLAPKGLPTEQMRLVVLCAFDAEKDDPSRRPADC